MALVVSAVVLAQALTAGSAFASIVDPALLQAPATSSATETGATITSDKADYQPGETVVLSGTGWQPGETVQIVVKDDGLQSEAWQRDVPVIADEQGAITDQFELPTWVIANYTVTATGELSGTAFTTFTDAYVNRGCGAAPSNPIVVTSLVDGFSATNDSVCSLREAINASNELATVNAITLVSGTYTLSLTAGSNDESRDDLDVMDDLTITGAGSASTAIDAQSLFRVIHQQNADTDLTLNDLTVQNGNMAAAGGGIRVDDGTSPKPVTLKLNRVIVTNNTITGGNAGGGILLNNANQTATLEDSSVTNNNGNCGGCDGAGIGNTGGATLNLKNTSVTGNTTHDNGGGIFLSQAGHVVLDNSHVNTNHSVDSGGILNADGTGGGVHMLDNDSTLELKNGSTINGNDAPQDGGGLWNQNGQVTIGGDSEVNNNVSGRNGGGVNTNTARPSFTFTDSTIAGNVAGQDGGGLYGVLGADDNILSITKSTISGNTAGRDGGGVWLDESGTLANDTITNNTATAGGGAGLLGRGNNHTIGLTNVTLSHNTAPVALNSNPTPTPNADGIQSGREGPGDVATINLSNTIVAVNGDPGGTNCSSADPPPPALANIVNVTNNLDSGTTCGFGAANNSQSSANANLGPLQNNGGPTETRALQSGSAALDKASNTVCAAVPVNNVDQRGASRPSDDDAIPGAVCDIGAFEGVAVTTTTVHIAKDFSDDNAAPVTIGLSCPGATVTPTDTDAIDKDLGPSADTADFTVNGFTPNTTTCTATENPVPTGYSSTGTCSTGALTVAGPNGCTITNTLNSATFTVNKDYSDVPGAGANTAVTVSLNCSAGVGVSAIDNQASEGTGTNPASFTVTGFDPATSTCTATESGLPAGYTKDESGCLNKALPLAGQSCTITNTLNSATFTVSKDYSDVPGAGANTAVTVSLNCSAGVGVSAIDNQASEGTGTNPASFTVTGFDPATSTCTATESGLPAGYTKDESGCLNKALPLAGQSCTITNTLNGTTVHIAKDFSDNNDDPVTIGLSCPGATVTPTDTTAVDKDLLVDADTADFNVTGFTPGPYGTSCTATETPVPTGYSSTGTCSTGKLTIAGPNGCTITNTLKTATVRVYKDFANESKNTPVDVSLTCTGTAQITQPAPTQAAEGAPAVFTVTGFGASDSCSATESNVPTGYSQTGNTCTNANLTLVNGGTRNCTITNTLNSTTVSISKDFVGETKSDSVTVQLNCGAGVTVTPASAGATETVPASFTVTGFTTGSGGTTCTATENPVPAGYTSSGCTTAVLTVAGPNGCTINNVAVGQVSFLTSSGGCLFDIDNTASNGRQWRNIFTPDPQNMPRYKMTATNPGQFMYAVSHFGTPGSSVTFNLKIPYPFVTQSAVPIHAYSAVSFAQNGCATPSGEFYTNSSKITLTGTTGYSGTFGTTKTVGPITLTMPASGFVYLRIHLDYGLKGFGNYDNTNNNATSTTPLTSPQPINDLTPHTFSVTNGATDSDTVQNKNVFKHDPGFAGLVKNSYGNPVPNAKVEIWQGTKLAQTVYTDADGWYVWTYKYTGKATSFTLKLPAYPAVSPQNVTIKSNGFVVTNFTVP